MSTSPSITEARVTVKSLDDFAYEALLTEGEIRILILEPGVFDEVLRCTLLVTSLDNAPYFEAISYVWENQERSSELLCHDKSMHVTPSLALILRRMRLETQSRAIWADSICINQRDLIEKGKQVAFMAEIYSKADRTLIFVGNFGLECTEDLQVLLNEVEEDFMKDVLPGWNSLPRVASDHPLRSDKRWECIKYLSKNKWFSRGWCVQEAAVARDGQIIWGNAMLSWSQLMRVAWFAKNRLFAVFTEHISLPFLHMSAYLRTHEDEVKPFVDEESGSQFGKTLEYLQAARGLGLSQPHDRIYAFTNLPTSDEISNLNINPDYTKSFEDVCQDLAVRIIGTHQNLDVLMYVNHTQDSMHGIVPSWVPLWSADKEVSRNIETSRSMEPVLIELDSPLIPKDGMLEARGIRFATIKYVSGRIKENIRTIDDVAVLWSEVSKFEIMKWSPKHDLILMFVTALAAGSSTGDEDNYSEHMAALITETERLSGTCQEMENKHDWEAQAQNGNAEECLKWILLQCHGRVVVVTERGYGLAPLAQVGDECAILHGGKVGFLVRHVEDDKFKLVAPLFHSSEYCIRNLRTKQISGMGLWDARDWEEWDLVTETMVLI